MIRRLGPDVTVHELDAGHEVMLTQPVALAEILNATRDRVVGGPADERRR